jgi:hypothetical protein
MLNGTTVTNDLTILTVEHFTLQSAYTEIAPNLRDSLVRSIHDDFRGINAEMGSEQSWWQRLMPTYVVISFVTSVVSGAEVAFALGEIFRVTPLVQAAAAVATFTINAIGFRIIAGRLWSTVDLASLYGILRIQRSSSFLTANYLTLLAMEVK